MDTIYDIAQDGARLVKAQRRALMRYPGPVGRLVADQLQTWSDFGYRFGGSNIRQVIDFLTPEDAVEKQPPMQGPMPAGG